MVPAMLMRGGTSKGLYFLADDLPTDPVERDSLLLRLMGSPDARQIDGIGGATPLTSKVAIVGPATDDAVDVEYLFLQIGVDQATVSDGQNCGNLLAGVGQFALERGLLTRPDGPAMVRIAMLNTGTTAASTFDVAGGLPVYHGATAISGVPGTAGAVRLDFHDTVGATCGALLPTGRAVDQIDGVACTLIDNGMPTVVMAASEFGISGYESCPDLEANHELRARLESIRAQAGPLMQLGDVAEATIPKMTMVAPPAADGHLSTRTFIPHRCHEAIGVLGAVSVATAILIPGTRARELAETVSGDVVLEHPTGSFTVAMQAEPANPTAGDDLAPAIQRVGIIRTARKLMDGVVFPRQP